MQNDENRNISVVKHFQLLKYETIYTLKISYVCINDENRNISNEVFQTRGLHKPKFSGTSRLVGKKVWPEPSLKKHKTK